MTPGEVAALLAGRAARRETRTAGMEIRLNATVTRMLGDEPGMSPKEQSVIWQEVHHLASEARAALANAYDWAGLAESHEREMIRTVRCADETSAVGPHTAAVLYRWAWDEYRDSVRCYSECDRFAADAWQLLASCRARLAGMAAQMGGR